MEFVCLAESRLHIELLLLHFTLFNAFILSSLPIIVGAGEDAQNDGVVGAAQVGPSGGGGFADGFGVDWRTGGRESRRDFGR